MSQTLALPSSVSVPARPWRVAAAFPFVVAVFFLAEPLEFAFSRSDSLNIDEVEVATADRVDMNILSSQEGNVGRQGAMVALGAVGLVLLVVPSPNRLRVVGPLGTAVLLFLAWCAATVLWSDLPFLTMRKLSVLACLALGAAGFARQLTLRELLYLTLFGTGALLFAGVAAELALGTFRPWKGEYRFAGLTWPAFTAWDASLFVLAALALRRDAPPFPPPAGGRELGWGRAALGAAALGAAALLVLTKTRASIGGMAAAFAAHAAFTWPARRKWIGALALCITASFGVLALEWAGPRGLDGAADLVNLGRSESMEGISGRAGLWQDLLAYLYESPIGGRGYDSFWTPRRLLDIGQDNWGAPDAHNGFLNLALGVGLVGAGLYVGVLLLGLGRAWKEYQKVQNVFYVFAFCALVVLVVNGLFVSTQLAPALYSFLTMTLLARLGFVAPPRGEGGAP